MARLKQLHTTFGRGQIDPSAQGLVDTELYAKAVKTLTNWRITAAGSLKRRPCTEHITTVAGEARLVPFVFTEGTEYIFAFYASNVAIFGTDGTLHDTLSTPYTLAEAWEMDYAQQGDVMICVHKDNEPRVITRDDATSFSIATLSYASQLIEGTSGIERVFEPFFQYSTEDQYMYVNGSGVGVTLQVQNEGGVAQQYFQGTKADWNGVRFRYHKKYQYELGTPSTASQSSANNEGDGLSKIPFPVAEPFRSTAGSALTKVDWPFHGFDDGDSITISGADHNNVAGVISSQINKAHTITVLDRDTFEFSHGGTNTYGEDWGGPIVHVANTVPPKTNWFDESAYSDYRGWPAAVTFHENRLVLGGGPSLPDTLFMSQSGSYFNFDTGEGLDNEAIAITLASGQISEIKHMVSNRDLQIFTASHEFYIPQAVDGGPLTPANIRASRQTAYGSGDVEPMVLEGATIFGQTNGKALREFALAGGGAEAYEALSLTVFSEELITNPVQMSVSTGTSLGGEQYMYVINNDGSAAVLHQLKQQQTAGWGGWTTDGDFKSVISMGDNTYFLVERTINSVTTYCLEKLHLDETYWLDGAVTSTGPVGDVFSGFDAYDNQQLHVVDTDTNEYLGTFTVNGVGEIDVGESGHSNIVAGFNYTPTLETLPVEMQLSDGMSVGRQKRIVSSILRFRGTINASVDSMAITVADEVGSTPFTGEAKFHHRGISRDPTLTLTQTEPLAIELLNWQQEVSF